MTTVPGNTQQSSKGAANDWFPFAILALYSLLPFVTFLNNNKAEAGLDALLTLYVLLLFVPGALLVLGCRARWGQTGAERSAVVFAVFTFLFFRLDWFRDLAESLGIPPGGFQAIALWAAVTVFVLVLAFRLSRHRVIINYCLAAGVFLLLVPTIGYIGHKTSGDASVDFGQRVIPAAERHAGEGGPDIYVFSLDGYARGDQLRKLAGFDNKPFLNQLRKLGFSVENRALAAYPMTLLSLASTLSMDYVVKAGRIRDYQPFERVIQGDSTVVQSLRRLGYRFSLATDYSTIQCNGQEDICIKPKGAGLTRFLGDREWVLLGATPLGNLLPRLGVKPIKGDDPSELLGPEDIARESEEDSGASPKFVFSHILTPHPPYRYRKDCSIRGAAELAHDEWGDPRVGALQYVQTIRCLNADVLRAIRQLDRQAIIVVTSDHGSAFGIDADLSPRVWTDSEVQQRYGVLSAVRLPPRCRSGQVAPRIPVNMFRILFACVTNEHIPLLPERHFASDYGNNPRVSELPRNRLDP